MTDPEGDRTLEDLLLSLASEGGQPTGESTGQLDPELLVSFVEGRLSESEREYVLQKLLESDEGRALAATLTDLREEGFLEPRETSHAPAAGTRRSSSLRLLAIAALVLLALGGALWAGGAFDAAVTDPDARLIAAARSLRAADPDLFQEFQPLAAAERAAPGPAVQRGGIRALRPVGLVLELDPEFAWVPIPGVSSYSVRVMDDEGNSVLELSTPEAFASSAPAADGAPLLTRGRTYVWDVEAASPLGPVDGQRTFTIATQAEGQRFARAALSIRESQPEDLHAVLVAHHAIRRGLLLEAGRVLDRRVTRHPEDALARDTLRYVQRQLGDPAANDSANAASR